MPIKKRIAPPSAKIRNLHLIKERKEQERKEYLRLISRLPEQIPVKDLAGFLRATPLDGPRTTNPHFEVSHKFRRGVKRNIRNSGTAIQAFCIGCQCATNSKEAKQLVLDCEDMDCPLWLFRLGSDPLYNRRS